MTDLSLVGKVSSNSQNLVKPLVSKKDIEEKKFDLFCHESDKKEKSSMENKAKNTDKSENIVRKLFDAVFSYRKADGVTCH